jgi:hypothetical protein
MKKVVGLMLLAAVIFAFSGIADAQIEEGDKELQALFSFQTTTGEAGVDTLILMGGLGYYFTQNHEAGINIMLMSVNLADEWIGAAPIQAFYTYNFIIQNPKLVPYVGGSLGKVVLIGDQFEDVSIWILGANGGIKYFISENTALVPQILLQRTMISDVDDENTFTLMVGLSTFF